MASWTDIANATLAEGEPIKASTQLSLRDNPIAIAEGRPDAPRVSPWAMAGVVVASGATTRYLDRSRFDLNITGFRVTHAVSVMNTGTVTVEWTVARTGGTGFVRTRLFVDRAGTATQQGAVESDFVETTNSRTVTVEPGDTLYLECRMQDSGATGWVQNFEIKTSGGLLYPMPPWFQYGTAPV